VKRRRARVGILVSICLAGLALLFAAPARSEPAYAAVSEQRILVLLRLTPQHYRPNSNYGGGYGEDLARGAGRRLAKRIAREHGLTLVDDWPMPLLGLDCFIMAVPEGQSIEDAAKHVSRDQRVAFSQPMHIYQARGEPRSYNDPLFPAQPVARQWRLADLHRVATGRGITVAVIDSKIEGLHPDLAGRIAISRDFVSRHGAAPEQHGTGVAGIIAATAGNAAGIVGVAPRARLMGLRACWQPAAQPPTANTVCDSLSLAKALHFAIEHKAQVINLSLSGPRDPLIGRLLKVGLARGAVVVAAFDRGLPGGGFPASFPGVVAVADESLAAPSAGVYTAPGRDVVTTQPGGRWYLVNGSSYATAHVSGLLALLRERRPLVAGRTALVAARAGGGSIDACAALLRTSQRCDCACALAPEVAANERR
jgi:hypothetical protein